MHGETRPRRYGIALLLPCMLCGAGVAIGDAPPASVSMTAARTATPVVLDGRLDEVAWGQAQVAHLTQQSPVPGGATPYATEIRVLRDDSHVYFGIVCHDPEP